MKKVILSLFVLAGSISFAQKTAKDFFSSDDMVWYGLNFSQARMIGQFDQAAGAGAATGSDIKNKWIPSWNGVIISEPKNFKREEAFRKTNIYNDIAATEKQNLAIDADKLMTYNPYSFSDPKETIKHVISSLSGGEKKEGIGVTFVVESFDKTNMKAVIYAVVFDIATKKVLISEKIEATPRGIGLRNFWAGAVKDAFKQIESSYYNKWKSDAK
ncbi:MAG: hypothetical protein JST26_10185 [Bacteroidetes bacterium]|nr:hypothetical protein [Bacteroidota bacterium]